MHKQSLPSLIDDQAVGGVLIRVSPSDTHKFFTTDLIAPILIEGANSLQPRLMSGMTLYTQTATIMEIILKMITPFGGALEDITELFVVIKDDPAISADALISRVTRAVNEALGLPQHYSARSFTLISRLPFDKYGQAVGIQARGIIPDSR